MQMVVFGTANIDTLAASAKIEDLTDNRLLLLELVEN